MADVEIERVCRNYGSFDEVIADTTAEERRLCTLLNLHSNVLTSCAGLDATALPALRELNLSSNRITTSDLQEISFLQSLTSLDLSGNLIRDVQMLPFLPGVQHLAVAFNPLQSLLFLNEAVPNLRVLDIRGHTLASLRNQRHFLSPLSCLVKLQELLLVGKARVVDAADVLGVFAAAPSLQLIDCLREEQWRSDLLQQGSSCTMDEQRVDTGTPAISSEEAGGLLVDTPKFDQVARAFKVRLLSSSGDGGEGDLSAALDQSAFPAEPAAQTREAGCSPMAVQVEGPQQGALESAEPAAPAEPSPSVPPPEPSPHAAPLLLSLDRMAERRRMRSLHRAFSAMLCARELQAAAARETKHRQEERERQLEQELLGKRLLQERARADASSRRVVQCEAVNMGLRRQLDTAAADASALLQAAAESGARAEERQRCCAELAAQLEALQAAAAAAAAESSLLREQCEGLRGAQGRSVEEARAAAEAQRLEAQQLRLEVQQLRQQLSDRESGAAEQAQRLMDLSRQSQEQLQEALSHSKRTAEERLATLRAVNEASQALVREERARAEGAEAALAAAQGLSSRAERRARAAQQAFEQGAEQLAAAAREKQALQERNGLLAQKVEELSACARRLQAGLQQAEQRAAEQRAAEQRAAEQRAAEQRAAEQRAAEQKVVAQSAATSPQRPDDRAAAAAELMSRLDGLEEGLVARTGELREAQQRLCSAESRAASSQQQQDLQLAVRVKDKQLADQAAAAAALRSRATEREAELRRLADALSRAEARLERSSSDVLELEEELAAKAHVERELRSLLEELRCDGGSLHADDGAAAGGAQWCSNPVCARESSRSAAEAAAERGRREAAERLLEGARLEAQGAAAASALLREQARVLEEDKARCEAALQQAAVERRAQQRAVKRLESDCLRRDEELQASRRRVGLLKSALVDM